MSVPSTSSIQVSQLKEIIDKLPEEYRKAMNFGIVVEVGNLNNKLKGQIYDAKKEELIEKLSTQINFTVSKALLDKKYEIIKKDIIFYKNAYESEAANINKLIEATNKLNRELYKPLKDIKISIHQHLKEFGKNIENLKIPHDGISKGVESIKNNQIENDKKKEFEEKKSELDKSMDLYKMKAIEFFEDYNKMNKDLTENINDFLDSFIELKNNIGNLKEEINKGFGIFENISPQLENLDDQENIRKLTADLLFPLDSITKLISKSQKQIDDLVKDGNKDENKDENKDIIKLPNKGKEKKEINDLGNTMIQICTDLKSKATNISERINELRMKINLTPVELPPIELKEPDVKNINNNIEKMIDELEKTKKENENIQDEVLKRTKDFLNQTRLDILFIIDCTNSVNLYLEEIKSNFTNMIQNIQTTCPMATIYIGFIGYLDFIDLMLDSKYINIELTKDIKSITEQIENLKSHGGGDIAEDIAGAFDMALKKDWQGISRFAILAADAPCHGVEFHGRANDKNYDNYPEGDPEKRDIKKFVRKFAEKNISLFCAKFSDDTDMMFDIFRKEYNKGIKEGAHCEFTTEKCEDLCEIIIQKATQVYQVNRKEE